MFPDPIGQSRARLGTENASKDHIESYMVSFSRIYVLGHRIVSVNGKGLHISSQGGIPLLPLADVCFPTNTIVLILMGSADLPSGL